MLRKIITGLILSLSLCVAHAEIIAPATDTNEVYIVGSKKSNQYVVRFDYHNAYIANSDASKYSLKENKWMVNPHFKSQSYMRKLAFDSEHRASKKVIMDLKEHGLWQADQIISSGEIPASADFAFCGYLSIDDDLMVAADGNVAEMCFGEQLSGDENRWFITSNGFIPSDERDAHYFRTSDYKCYQLTKIKDLDNYFALRLQRESRCGF